MDYHLTIETEFNKTHFAPSRPQGADYFDFCVKNDIPHYGGQMNIIEFLAWVKAVDNFFEYMEDLEDRQVKMIAYKLKGGASAWWDRIQSTKIRHRELLIQSWEWMRKLTYDQFLLADY